MQDFLINLIFNFNLNVAVSCITLFIMLFNISVLRLKKEYRLMNYKIILILSLCPILNIVFMIFNALMLSMSILGYKIIKKKGKKLKRV